MDMAGIGIPEYTASGRPGDTVTSGEITGTRSMDCPMLIVLSIPALTVGIGIYFYKNIARIFKTAQVISTNNTVGGGGIRAANRQCNITVIKTCSRRPLKPVCSACKQLYGLSLAQSSWFAVFILKAYCTFTKTESFALQPCRLVPFTIYFLAESGVATGLAQFVQLRPAEGLQL